MALANSAASRWTTLRIAWLVLVFRPIVPGRLVQRAVLWFVRKEAACCRAESPHFKFMQRYLDQFERVGTLDRIRRYLREQPLSRAASRLDAWLRIGLLGTLRHEVLNGHRGAPGIPRRLLIEAQLALSPGCDLACEGCYSADDRGGVAPRRARIERLVDEAVSCGAFAVHVVGKGEPFLSPTWANELLDVVASRPHVFFTIASHGAHIDDALAARIGALGNLVVLVAVDGLEAGHDLRRGEGSYRRVSEALARLRRHGALYGFSCMVSAKSHRDLTSPGFIAAREDAGCAVGVYSRFFPLASSDGMGLALDAHDLAEYQRAFERARLDAHIPLLDLDEVEQHTGCHSRAGESVYIDGITGRVSPCLRVPFAPAECRVDLDRRGSLADALAHPFFVAYQNSDTTCPSWCGANLGAELGAVGALLDEHASHSERLDEYQQRGSEAARPIRRLPLLPTGTDP